MKHCELGDHMVEKLFHAKRKDRPSGCQNCVMKQKAMDQSKSSVRVSSGAGDGIINPKLSSTLDRIDAAITQNRQIFQKRRQEKSIPDLIKLAVIVFHKWIRNRDLQSNVFCCISCNKWKTESEMDAGHYMPSTYTSLKFNEYNVNGQCQQCNRHDPDHLIGYRLGLMRKIGVEKVLELESTPLALYYKWDRDELLEIINKYKL